MMNWMPSIKQVSPVPADAVIVPSLVNVPPDSIVAAPPLPRNSYVAPAWLSSVVRSGAEQ